MAAPVPGDVAPAPTVNRRRVSLIAWVGGVLAFVVLTALGTWQLHRMAWKHDLIARVEARVHAAPASLPGPAAWPGLRPEAFEYRRVMAKGFFDNSQETFVQAVTDFGGGFWVLTPFHTGDGFTVLVNRGFVPPDRRDPATRPAGTISGETVVTGLLRVSEPKGGFLRANDPASGRWFSRDVTAIAAARGLSRVAPYFVDADASPNPGGYPIGGLTVIVFPDNHLVYAFTWYTLAAMVAGAGFWVLRDARSRGAGDL